MYVRVIQCMHVFLYVYLYLCVFLCVCFWKYAQYNNADKLQNYKLMHNLQHIHTQTVTYTHAHIHTHKQTHTCTQSYCAHIFMVKLLFSKLQITNIKFCILTTRWVGSLIVMFYLLKLNLDLKTSANIDLNQKKHVWRS